MKILTSSNLLSLKAVNQPTSVKVLIIPDHGIRAINKRSGWILLLFILLLGLKLSAQVSMVRLKVSGPNNALDETVLYYQDGATMSFDSDFDAYKINGPNPCLMISQFFDNIRFMINAIEPVNNSLSMPILVTSPVGNTYTVFASDFQDMPYGTCIRLHDRYNGSSIDLKTSNYSFYLSDTTMSPRFDLIITYMNMPIESQLIHANCTTPLGNYIVKGTGSGPWNYIWKDTTNNVLKTKLNTLEEDSFNLNLQGVNKVYIESIGGCGYNNASFSIDLLLMPDASFIMPDTIVLDSSYVLQPINNSINTSDYLWNFGESDLSAFDTASTHAYYTPGEYQVTLVAFNTFGCTDTLTENIVIIPEMLTGSTIGLIKFQENNLLNINCTYLGGNYFSIINSDEISYNVKISDVNGRNILDENHTQINTNLDLSDFTRGYYVVKVQSKAQSKMFSIVVY